MSSNKRKDRDDDARTLRDLANGSRKVPSEYESQPDSNSVIGGIRGRQEYGITGEIAADSDPYEVGNNPTMGQTTLESGGSEISGLSEFAENALHPIDDESSERKPRSDEFDVAEKSLELMIVDRLGRNENIDTGRLVISARSHGQVVLSGIVPTAMEKLRTEEIVSAIPGVKNIQNLIEVRS